MWGCLVCMPGVRLCCGLLDIRPLLMLLFLVWAAAVYLSPPTVCTCAHEAVCTRAPLPDLLWANVCVCVRAL